MSLKAEIDLTEARLRSCIENGDGYEEQKRLENELSELRQRLHHEAMKANLHEQSRLAYDIESHQELIETLETQMRGVEKEIEEKLDELQDLRQLHAGWTAQRYIAEQDISSARRLINELKRKRAIRISEYLADKKFIEMRQS